MTVATIKPLFDALRANLVPLAAAITARPAPDEGILQHAAPPEDQLAFGLEVIRRFGYDFNRGRQDLTHHPFMTKFSLGDIRITTRVRDEDFTDSLFSTLHESGHALYEQGIRMDLEGTPLATGTSAGVHESQSRTWENIVGRSRAMWTHFYPKLQQRFPEALRGVSLDRFYRAINKVQPSLIRTDADEVTYNLHVMIRFDLELDLLDGRLKIADLPEAWHARYQQDLGVRAQDDRDGVLQDVHWHGGFIGGQFQGYTLGNIMAAQFYAAAVRKHPSIPKEIENGEFGTLRGWLRDNVYQHGAKFTASELLERATGKPMGTDDYIAYLWNKYQPLYQLEGEPAPV
jgi:carboxypeptidase Taq